MPMDNYDLNRLALDDQKYIIAGYCLVQHLNQTIFGEKYATCCLKIDQDPVDSHGKLLLVSVKFLMK